jgi:transcriptional regulator with XRE-family HTH domain
MSRKLPSSHANTLANRLREAREKCGMSITDAATKAGVTKSHISMIEKGENRPSTKLLLKLEDIYEVAPGELFAFIGRVRPQETLPSSRKLESQIKTTTDDRYGGIIGYSEGLMTGTLANAIHATQKSIDIVDTWIGEDLRRLEGPFQEAIIRGVNMRIILLHPDLIHERVKNMGMGERHRSMYLESGQITAKQNIATLMKWHQRWYKEWGVYRQERNQARKTNPHLEPMRDWDENCLQVRLLPFMPAIQYYKYDNMASIGFYLNIAGSRQGPRLEINIYKQNFHGHDMRTVLGRYIDDEFTYLWNLLQNAPSSHINLQQDESLAFPPAQVIQEEINEKASLSDEDDSVLLFYRS